MNKYVRRIFVDATSGSYIDTVHKELCQMSEEQNRDDKKCYYIYYTNFNGREIDSTMNIDEVYSILDINKNEEEVNREETNEEERLKNFADIAQVYYFKLNNEQQKRFEDIDWFKIVNHSIYYGKECVAALHIVSMFNENKDISEIKKYLGTHRLELPKFIVDLPWLGAPIKNYWHQLTHNQDELLNIFNKLVGPLSDKGWDGVTTFLNSTVQLLFVLFIAWFLYFDGLRIAAWLSKIAQRMAPDLGKVLLTQSMITVRAVMLGLMGSALGQSLCMAIGLWIAGVPQIGLLSAATFFLSLLPGGPLLVWGGAAVWLYLEQSYGSMIFMLCWGVLVVSSVDNFLKPLIMSKGTDLSLLLVTLGVFGGALAFGFIGLFLGPVILGLVSTLLDIWLEQDIVENDKPPSENSTLKK